MIGKTDYDVFSRDYADIYFRPEKQVFNGEVTVACEIQPYVDNNGIDGWVDNRKYPIRNEHIACLDYSIADDLVDGKNWSLIV